jgi:integrase
VLLRDSCETGDNPARWKGHLDSVLPNRSKVQKVINHAALPYDRIPAFIVSLRQQEGIGAKAAELLILTATRTKEDRFAAWFEFGLADRLSTIPAVRMKADRDHRIPLPGPAFDLIKRLENQRTDDRLVFPGLGQHAILKALQRVDHSVTGHGFRSTFADWCAKTGKPEDIREAALAHAINKVADAYQRSDLFDRRRQLMEEWERYCTTFPIARDPPIRNFLQHQGAHSIAKYARSFLLLLEMSECVLEDIDHVHLVSVRYTPSKQM